MSLKATVTSHDITQGNIRYFGTIVPTGNYVAGGDQLDLGAGAAYPPGEAGPMSTSAPFKVRIFSKAAPNSGYDYEYVPGSTASNGKMQVLTGSAAQSPSTELTAGAYPGGVTGDTIAFEAEFRRI